MGDFEQKGGGSREGGGGGVSFTIGGCEVFKVSLYSWQRAANPLIL